MAAVSGSSALQPTTHNKRTKPEDSDQDYISREIRISQNCFGICQKCFASCYTVNQEALQKDCASILEKGLNPHKHPTEALIHLKDKVAFAIMNHTPAGFPHAERALWARLDKAMEELDAMTPVSEFKGIGTQISDWHKKQLEMAEQIADAISNPRVQAAHYAEIATRWAELGDPDKAQAVLEKIAEGNGKNNLVLVQIAIAWLRQGKIEKGLVALSQLSSADPKLLAMGNLELVRAYLHLTPPNIEAATRAFENVPADKRNSYNNISIAMAFVRCKEIAKALDIVRGMDSGAGRDVILNMIIPVLIESKDVKTAIEMIPLLDPKATKNLTGDFCEQVITILLSNPDAPGVLDQAIAVAPLMQFYPMQSERVVDAMLPLLMASGRTLEAINLIMTLLDNNSQYPLNLLLILQELKKQVKPGTTLIDLIPVRALTPHTRRCIVQALLRLDMPEEAEKVAALIFIPEETESEDSLKKYQHAEYERFNAFSTLTKFYENRNELEKMEKAVDQLLHNIEKAEGLASLVILFQGQGKPAEALRIAEKILTCAHTCPEKLSAWKEAFLEKAARAFLALGNIPKVCQIAQEMSSTAADNLLGEILANLWKNLNLTEATEFLSNLADPVTKSRILCLAILKLPTDVILAIPEIQNAFPSIIRLYDREHLVNIWLREKKLDLSVPIKVTQDTQESQEKARMCNSIINACVARRDMPNANRVIAMLPQDKAEAIRSKIALHFLAHAPKNWEDLNKSVAFSDYWNKEPKQGGPLYGSIHPYRGYE